MKTKIKDLSIDEFKHLISDVVQDSFQENLEDLVALSSDPYIKSITEARNDYKKGKVKSFSEVFDV
ncbi:MAG TPA: hypothetical protein DHW82_14525 [Spirochaetia bacterium]|nr:MAG: hypothetical protein A2Y41_05795 [Spirochaetes bacterium GWB1_36_13]HCL58203.1 hypothetical protein [Spirochaetia bacterium]